MKKIALVLAIVLVISSMSLLLFACTAKVAGKTYVMESFEISADGVPESITEQVRSYVENSYKTAELTFNKDGKMILKSGDVEKDMGYYKQDGKNIYVGSTEDVSTEGNPEFVVDGKSLIWTVEQAVMSYTVVIKMTIVPKK